MKILGLVLVGVVVIQFTVVPSNDMALEAAPNDAHSVYLPLIRAGVAPVIPDTTVVLDDATLADLTTLSPNGTLVFAHAHPSLTTLQPNDVLVGSVTAAAPSGFLRMVDSVTEANGQILVQTHQATLEDAIQDGAMFIHQELSPTAVTAIAMMDGVRSINQSSRPASSEFALQLNDLVLYDHDNNPATENDRILANGSVRLNLSYEFDMVVNSGQLERLMIKSISTQTAELEISSSVTIAEVDVKKELARYTFTPIITYVGVLPVVFVPVLTINVGINGTLQATVSASVTQQATSTSGLQYANGTWQPIQSFVNSFTYNPPTLSTSLDAKAFIV